ncbi:MAG TPA: hypothetical protein VFP61_08715, partial [Acidimicrobiales bacterium]|nr:hypothetical protein [Acidimicrobiales bacterium]
MSSTAARLTSTMANPDEVERLVSGTHTDPHHLLGRHDGVVRAWRPGATAMRVRADGGDAVEMTQVHPAGLWEASLPDSAGGYRYEADYGASGSTTTYSFDDPYRSWPTLGDLDLHLFGEGRHRRLWRVLGSHVREHDGMVGTSFAVWAPNA